MRAVAAARGLAGVGFACVMMWLFFPRVFFVPVVVIVGVMYVSLFIGPTRVTLDRLGGEVAITTGLWTRHVRLTQIKRVKVRRSEFKIRTRGKKNDIGVSWMSRSTERLLRIRSGFEGMDRAITRAAAAARAAEPGRAAAADAVSRRKIPAFCYLFGVGLLSLGAAAVVQPQAGGWLVSAAAVVLRIGYAALGGVAMLIGAGLVCGAWRARRSPDTTKA